MPEKRIASKKKRDSAIPQLKALKNKLARQSLDKIQSSRNSIALRTPAANSGLNTGLHSGASTSKAADFKGALFRKSLASQQELHEKKTFEQSMFHT